MTMQQMDAYQQAAYDQISPTKRMIVLPYGSGKTWQAIRASVEAHDSDERFPEDRESVTALIFVISWNMPTWKREILLRYPEARVICGEQELRQASTEDEWPDVHTFVLFPHHRIAACEELLIKFHNVFGVATWVCDESTKFKNPRTQMVKAAHRIRKTFADARYLALTGKPCPEGYHELWAQFYWCYGETSPFGSSYYAFLHHWFVKSDYGYALNTAKKKEFLEIAVKHMVLFSPEEMNEHLEKLGTSRHYEMAMYEESPQQRALLDHLYTHWELPFPSYYEAEAAAEGAIEAIQTEEYWHTMSLAMKAQQIASGFYYNEHLVPTFLEANPKLDLLVHLLTTLLGEDDQRSIIVWYRFIAEGDMLYTILNAKGFFTVKGPEERALVAFSNFTDQLRPRVILMPCGISQGFNELVVADTCIFWSNVYSNELRGQQEARIDRLGQRNSYLRYIDLCSGRLADIEIVTALQAKNMSKARLNTIVRKYASLQPGNHS